MTKQALAQQIYETAHLVGTFTLRSGQVSKEYFDKYLFESNPILLDEIVSQMVNLIPEGTELLAGLEMGGIPIATALSLKSGIPVTFVRKEAKSYGTCKVAEGAPVNQKKVLIIEDVVTTGGQILLSAEDLKAHGAVVEQVLCVIQRDVKGRDKIHAAGMKLTALMTMEDLKAHL